MHGLLILHAGIQGFFYNNIYGSISVTARNRKHMENAILLKDVVQVGVIFTFLLSMYNKMLECVTRVLWVACK